MTMLASIPFPLKKARPIGSAALTRTISYTTLNLRASMDVHHSQLGQFPTFRPPAAFGALAAIARNQWDRGGTSRDQRWGRLGGEEVR